MRITSPPPISSSDTEALFCVALLNTLNTQQTADVLARFLELRENPSPALVALGRIPPPDAVFVHADVPHYQFPPDTQTTPAQPVPPTAQTPFTSSTTDKPTHYTRP